MSEFETYFNALREDIREMKAEITARLDTMNGSVRRHETDIALLKADSHAQESCPLVHTMSAELQELKANQKSLKTGIAWVFGALSVVGAAIIGLLEAHSYLK